MSYRANFVNQHIGDRHVGFHFALCSARYYETQQYVLVIFYSVHIGIPQYQIATEYQQIYSRLGGLHVSLTSYFAEES